MKKVTLEEQYQFAGQHAGRHQQSIRDKREKWAKLFSRPL